ncbi:MAG: DUF3089 domain-containing protein [Pseudomonadota bacterium]
MRRVLACFFLYLVLSACSDGSDSNSEAVPTNPFPGFSSSQYEDLDNWLCHPDLPDSEDICDSNLDTTVVFADGSTEIEPHRRASDPQVDCFYVYPTVSGDPGGNADLNEGTEEQFTTLNQAARYSRFCRLFAPIYRQTTIASIFTGAEGDRELAYGDVLASFKQYMATRNNDRGVLLIGHSQGSSHLRRLVAEVIEQDDYLLEHLIAAHLIGSTVRVADGADIGGSFSQVPVCRSTDQTGCVVSYVTYRSSDPFLASGQGRFGAPTDNQTAICVNPAAPAGGAANLSPYFPEGSLQTLSAVIIPRAQGPFAAADTAPPITTPFFRMPDFIRAECKVDDNGYSYLEARALADSTDPRADDFNGEFILGDGWGLHLVDVTLAMGDLVDLGHLQALAWLSDR